MRECDYIDWKTMFVRGSVLQSRLLQLMKTNEMTERVKKKKQQQNYNEKTKFDKTIE